MDQREDETEWSCMLVYRMSIKCMNETDNRQKDLDSRHFQPSKQTK